MSRRFRLIAALLSLLSFSASFAEAVWASTCPPMDAPASAMADAATSNAMADAATSNAMAMHGMDMPESPQPSDDSQAPRAPDCPLAAVATSGCHTISIPSATGVTTPAPLPANAVPIVAVDRVPHLLLAVSLFRPPRA